MKIIHFRYLGFQFVAHIGFKWQQKIPKISDLNATQQQQWLYHWAKQQIQKVNSSSGYSTTYVSFLLEQFEFIQINEQNRLNELNNQPKNIINVNELFAYWFCSILSENLVKPTKIYIDSTTSLYLTAKESSQSIKGSVAPKFLNFLNFIQNTDIQLTYDDSNSEMTETIKKEQEDIFKQFTYFLQKNPDLWKSQVTEWNIFNHESLSKTPTFFNQLHLLNITLFLCNGFLLLLLFLIFYF